jgi:hypothetical protein
MDEDLKKADGNKKKKDEHKTADAGFLAKLTVIEFIETTSFHGISNVYRAELWAARIFWILLILVSSAYCFYGIFKHFSQNHFDD